MGELMELCQQLVVLTGIFRNEKLTLTLNVATHGVLLITRR
jgi:hypothetical protein